MKHTIGIYKHYNIGEVCFNGRFEDYEDLHGIVTKKNWINLCNFLSFDVVFLAIYFSAQFLPISMIYMYHLLSYYHYEKDKVEQFGLGCPLLHVTKKDNVK